jgi:molecular chaperone HtpG
MEFLEEKKLKDLIKTHSEFISFPIELLVEKTKEEEVSDDDSDEEEGEKKEGEEGEKKEGEEGDDNIE